jgi:hypothetical protein
LVGDDCRVVEVKCGEPWPADARGRIDVLIRVGHVIRFVDGVPDRRSRRYVKRLGMRPPPLSFQRTFEQRARAEALKVEIAGQRIRVFAGRPDGDLGDLFVVNGRAYVLRRGMPDGPAAVGAPSAARGNTREAPRRRPAAKGEQEKKRRRRKPSRT